MKKLQALYNEDANKIIEEVTQDKAIKNLNFLITSAMVTIDTIPVPGKPTTFAKAWNHPNANSCEKWREAICNEFADMNKQQVWCKTSKTRMPPTQWCLKNKCVFMIKHNGVCQAHLVACGYSLVPGIEFSDNYSLVVNKVTFCVPLLMVLHFGYLAKIVNVETAFLYRDLKEGIKWSALKE